MVTRLNQEDWKLIYRYLSSFRHLEGVSAVLDKVQQHIVEGDSEYIKVVRIEFLPPPDPPEPATGNPAEPDDAAWLRRLEAHHCEVMLARPPVYAVRVPEHPDDFDEAIDLLEALHRRKRIRYRR